MSVMMIQRPPSLTPRQLPAGPPQEPLALRMACLYGRNSAEKDKKILQHIIDHCSHCSSYHEDNLQRSHSKCTDSICGYFYWYYRHFWEKHTLQGQTMDECSACANCSRLYQWMLAHSSECLSRYTECCLALCHKMKKFQHLTNLGKSDHEFIRVIDGSLQPVASHAEPSAQSYTTSSLPPRNYPSRSPRSSTHQNDYTSPGVVASHTMSSDNQRVLNVQAMASCQDATRTATPMQNGSCVQGRTPALSLPSVEQAPLALNHSNGCSTRQSYSATSPFGNGRAGVSSSHYSPGYGSQYCDSEYPFAMQNGSAKPHYQCDRVLNGVSELTASHDARCSCPSTPSGLHQLATPTGNPKMNRQISNTSSGYGTGTSTGRQSVASISSQDQSYQSELSVDPENSLHVSTPPLRKTSAPSAFQGNGTKKKIQPQQSRSLTNFDNIPEYGGGRRDEERGLALVEEHPSQPSSLQRQDTDPGGKMVSGRLEASFDKSKFGGLMRRPMSMRQMAVEGSIELSPSPPTKRPLQREESDVASKVVLGDHGRQTGSKSITKENYDSILKFQEKHGILSDPSTRDKVLGKQKKQAAAAMRRSTIMSDVLSDFDTESSTSDIPGSSPLTSGDFSELDQDLTDQDEEKKNGGREEEEARILEDAEENMTVDKQIELIKARMKPLALHLASPKRCEGLSLPLDKSPPSYTGILTSYTSSNSDAPSTLEPLSNNTLKDEDYPTSGFPSASGRFGTDCSTLTGCSSEGTSASMRRQREQASGRNGDIMDTVDSPNGGMYGHTPDSRTVFHRPLILDSPSIQPSDERWYQYETRDDIRPQATEPNDVSSGLSPTVPAYVTGKYRLPPSKVQEMCKKVDDVKSMFQEDLLRMKRDGQLVKQEVPALTRDEQQRRIPGDYVYADIAGDSNMMFRGHFSAAFPESNFPELEKRYYHKTLNEQFPESKELIAKDVERRHLLRKHLLGKFHSGHAYREGVHWYRKTRLGKGGQAECFSIQDEQTKLMMALKEEREDPKTLDEAYVCMKLSSLSNACSNIVDYYCAGILPKEHNLRKRMTLIQVFMEMMPTCLHAYLLENGPFRTEDLHHYGYQLFEALDYLHSKLRIIHCDIKPSNLLLDFTAQRIKLTDFGFAQILEEYTNEVDGDDNAGTLSYNPPEHYREKRCSFAVDIWQAGCTLLTMATTRRPWRHLFMDVVRSGQSPPFVQAVRRGQADLIGQQTCGHMYPSFLDHSLKQLLHGCLHHDPKNRLSAQDCVYQLAMADTSHMDEQHRRMITQAFGHWRSPPPVLSTYERNVQYVDVYLERTTHAFIDHLRYSLSPGWLGRIPYREGMTFEQAKMDILQDFQVIKHLSFNLSTCENSPQAIFMKTAGHSVDLNFTLAPPQSLVDRTKAIVIMDMCSS